MKLVKTLINKQDLLQNPLDANKQQNDDAITENETEDDDNATDKYVTQFNQLKNKTFISKDQSKSPKSEQQNLATFINTQKGNPFSPLSRH